MVSIRAISESEITLAHRLHNRFTGQGRSLDTIESWYEATPELFVGAYDGDEPVGICTGRTVSGETAELAGLGVDSSVRREGVGSRLVETFEENAARLGFERITVASAGGYVDQFYADCGYAPEEILVRVSPGELPAEYRNLGFDVVNEATEGETKKLYIDVEELDPEYLAEVRDAFGDDEAIYIMENALS